MISRSDLVRLVQERAAGRCEYCKMHQALQGATFHLEHIRPSSRGGLTIAENLAWACPSCNSKKSDRTEAFDPETSRIVSLFNPRVDRWEDHFAWQGVEMIALTPIGRALVAAFDLNHERRLRIREAERLFDLFPP